ncbi:MAG: hypothetical protein J6Q30_00710 [Oscillospiraceae bacterium]|nr:hypothetical protein [Oscillospiraceae bacterium]
MARKSYIVKAGGDEFKLRLTLAGQKNLQAKNPDVPIMALVMGAVDDPGDMEALLTEALSWSGNENPTCDGAELYDRLVDDGKCGTGDFMELVLNIAHNAGLINEDERKKVQRAVERRMTRSFDQLIEEEDPFPDLSKDEEGDEGSDRPRMEMPTL